LSSIKEELTGIFGQQAVLDDPQTLEDYARDQSFVHPLRPRWLVRARDVSQVKGLVQWANVTNTALVPVSSGAPHFRGDTVPGVPGAVMVDLSGMKKIIHIDRRNRTAIIEPGVTYAQLQPELARAGLRLSPPLMPRANKSVLSSLLEREPTLVHRYQFAALDPLRCIEVVWGDGNQFRTGEAATQVSLEDSWKAGFAQVNPRGPAQTDFYKFVSAAQGTMGIVTWASIKCEVLPQVHKLFFVPGRKLEDLIDLAYRLIRFRFGDELLLLNSSNLASILGEGESQIKSLKEKLPPWSILIGVAGRNILPQERVEFQEKDIREIAQQFGLQALPSVQGTTGAEALRKIINPSREPYWKLGYSGGCQDIFFITTLDKTPEFLKTMHTAADAFSYPIPDIGVYVQPLHQGASCHIEFSLPYNPRDQAAMAKIKELYNRASAELLQQGAYFSRPYGIWASMMYNRDAQTTRVLKKVKAIFDPHNVMNPGKLCF
jgi:FAD/FMN-containing dehydrogenase